MEDAIAGLKTVVNEYKNELKQQLTKLIIQLYIDSNNDGIESDKQYLKQVIEQHKSFEAQNYRVLALKQKMRAQEGGSVTHAPSFVMIDPPTKLVDTIISNLSKIKYDENKGHFIDAPITIYNKSMGFSVQYFESHLKNKQEKTAADESFKGSLVYLGLHSQVGAKANRLLHRIQAVTQLETELKEKMSIKDAGVIKSVQNTVAICKANAPTWSERSFLDKLTDIISLGIKPALRTFFSKNKVKEIEKSIEDIQPQNTSSPLSQ